MSIFGGSWSKLLVGNRLLFLLFSFLLGIFLTLMHFNRLTIDCDWHSVENIVRLIQRVLKVEQFLNEFFRVWYFRRALTAHKCLNARNCLLLGLLDLASDFIVLLETANVEALLLKKLQIGSGFLVFVAHELHLALQLSGKRAFLLLWLSWALVRL